MASPPRLSVVIGTINRLELLKTCIDSIFQQTRTPIVVYIADAGSTDGTQDYLRLMASDRLVPKLAGKRLGQGKALNRTFRKIRTPYVAWLSDDNEIVNGGLDVAVDILDRHDEIGMVGLKVRDVSGPYVEAPYIGGVSSIGVLNVNQGVLRTHVLKKVGYFSEAFDFYGIDPDLTAKVLYSGHDIVYTKVVAVHHHRTWLSDTSSPAYIDQMRRRQWSLEFYQRKYDGFGVADRNWARKKRWWKQLHTRLVKWRHPSSSVPLFGGTYRDWKNVFTSRHIALLDPWLSMGHSFHLRQHVPRRLRPSTLPSDPATTPESSGRQSRRRGTAGGGSK